MADKKKKADDLPLGTGLVRRAAEAFKRRSADVDRIVDQSVTGPAKKANDENGANKK